jgi:hypothetical protein
LAKGSRYAARNLGIDPNPVSGGIDETEIPPGVIHICFAGTGDAPHTSNPSTSRTREVVELLAEEYLGKFINGG